MANKQLHLRIHDTFRCTGAECPASCCSYGWTITLDKETLAKWRRVAPDHKALNLLESYTAVRPGDSFPLKQVEKCCVHLTADGLCAVQLELGHDHLPRICMDYPRISRTVGNLDISSLRLSCPEVVRLLMEERNDEVFFTRRLGKRAHGEYQPTNLPTKLVAVLEEMIALAQLHDDRPIEVGLLLLAETLIEIATLSQQGQLKIPRLRKKIKRLPRRMQEIEEEIGKGEFAITDEEAGRFWHFVYRLGQYIGPTLDTLVIPDETLARLLGGAGAMPAPHEEIGRYLKESRSRLKSKAPRFYEHYMRRFLEVKFVNCNYPWNPPQSNIVEGFLFCILPYAYIQLFAMATFNRNGSLTQQDLVNIMFQSERKFDHSKEIHSFLEANPAYFRMDDYYRCFIEL